MAEVPKIVQHRMAAGPRPGSHPDADLLTAFAEHSLPSRERNSVLAHLAQCAECREVVMVAAPQSEAAAPAVPASSRWLGWPALRWGAVAACAVVVVAAVSLRPPWEHPSPAASRDEAPRAIGMAAEPEPPPAAPKAEIAASLDKDRGAMDLKSRADQAKPQQKILVAQPVLSSSAKGAPVAADKLALAANAPAAPPPAEEMQAANNVASAPAPAPAVSPLKEQARESADAGATQTAAVQGMLGKAKQAAPANSDFAFESKRAKSEAVPAAAGAFPARKLTPRWTLSADGTLQRSLDSGKTWKTIPVAANATLTAVAAMESDIWVGGSHGTLYHSTDAGDHWSQVVPTAGGQPLTSNIIGIEFSDVLHGKVTTVNQEVWTTDDGGQTWQLSH